MTLSQLRRKINDSNIGQKINNTIPGILVEGAGRGISDSISALADNAFFAGIIGADICSTVLDKRPLKWVFPVVMAGAVLCALKSTCENAETHYSHTSPLYRKRPFGLGETMERVPIKHALIQRLYRKEPEKAAALIIEDVYKNYL